MRNIAVVTIFKQEGPNYKKEWLPSTFLWTTAQRLEQSGQAIILIEPMSAAGLKAIIL